MRVRGHGSGPRSVIRLVFGRGHQDPAPQVRLPGCGAVPALTTSTLPGAGSRLNSSGWRSHRLSPSGSVLQ